MATQVMSISLNDEAAKVVEGWKAKRENVSDIICALIVGSTKKLSKNGDKKVQP